MASILAGGLKLGKKLFLGVIIIYNPVINIKVPEVLIKKDIIKNKKILNILTYK